MRPSRDAGGHARSLPAGPVSSAGRPRVVVGPAALGGHCRVLQFGRTVTLPRPSTILARVGERIRERGCLAELGNGLGRIGRPAGLLARPAVGHLVAPPSLDAAGPARRVHRIGACARPDSDHSAGRSHCPAGAGHRRPGRAARGDSAPCRTRPPADHRHAARRFQFGLDIRRRGAAATGDRRVVAVVVFTHLWARSWRPQVPIYRHVFSTATIVLACLAASAVVAATADSTRRSWSVAGANSGAACWPCWSTRR